MNNRRAGVPSSLYTEDYYLTDCGGHEEFNATRGHVLDQRLGKALAFGRVSAGERVLDIGCGRGEIVLHSARRGANAIGIDYSPAALRLASRTVNGSSNGHPGSGAIVGGNAKALCFPDESFDVVFLLDIVEHLYPQELEVMLGEVRRVLKPGGRVIVHTAPNRTFADYGFRFYTRYLHRVINRLFRRDHVEDLRRGLSRRVHVNELTLSELKYYLAAFPSKRVWLEVYIGDKRRLRTVIRGAITHLYPLSNFWPLNRLFAYWIWAVVRKETF